MGNKHIKSSGIPSTRLPPLLLALDTHWTQFPECCGRLEHYATEVQSIVRERVYYCRCSACKKLIEVVVKY